MFWNKPKEQEAPKAQEENNMSEHKLVGELQGVQREPQHMYFVKFANNNLQVWKVPMVHGKKKQEA